MTPPGQSEMMMRPMARGPDSWKMEMALMARSGRKMSWQSAPRMNALGN